MVAGAVTGNISAEATTRTLLLHTSRPIFIEFLTLPTKVLDTRAQIA